MIYTSYFNNLKNITILFPNSLFISVAGKNPDYFINLINSSPNKFLQFKKLAPKYEWWKQWHDQKLSNDWYIEKYYETVLSKLNPNDVYLQLTKNNTKDAVLLCYEKPGTFCHRHLISCWLNQALNLKIKEIF